MLLNEMEIFYHVVEQKNFTKAAEKLGVSKSFISKHIIKLEKELHVKLLIRNTRQLTLTETGQTFYQHCIKVVNEAYKSYHSINQLQQEPSGVLKISVPIALGFHLLASILPSFLKKYPKIILNIDLENRIVDVIKEGYDLVLRSAVLESSNLIAQKILCSKNIICASPIYLKIYGMPNTPRDLMKHHFAMYKNLKRSRKIKLIKNKHTEEIHIDAHLLTNQLDLIKQMVLSGHYIAVLPEFMVYKELKKKLLIHCLQNYQLEEDSIYLIYPDKELISNKAKYFIQMLKKNFRLD
ncbi:MAG: LysR family transcriptional regulator [Gammaproteobacteria bacterium]|nr:LysR family transcriptional regulator [Gammaproteobacteria bacterium]